MVTISYFHSPETSLVSSFSSRAPTHLPGPTLSVSHSKVFKTLRVRSAGFRYENVMFFIVLPQLQSTYLSLGSPSHWAWRTKTLTSPLTSQLLSTHISSNCIVWWKCFWQQKIFSQGAWSVLNFNKGASRAEVCGQDGGGNTNTGGGQRWGVAWRGSFCYLDTGWPKKMYWYNADGAIVHRLNRQWLEPLGPAKCILDRFLLTLSRIKRPQVMFMV